ncbi:MAG: hypothetical protein LBI71_11835 [Enterobacteriaceae bacterium]|jgi:hypothetical protein|nr:hypothetical protein [Enterobacteriaceae bacterium]
MGKTVSQTVIVFMEEKEVMDFLDNQGAMAGKALRVERVERVEMVALVVPAEMVETVEMAEMVAMGGKQHSN